MAVKSLFFWIYDINKFRTAGGACERAVRMVPSEAEKEVWDEAQKLFASFAINGW